MPVYRYGNKEINPKAFDVITYSPEEWYDTFDQLAAFREITVQLVARGVCKEQVVLAALDNQQIVRTQTFGGQAVISGMSYKALATSVEQMRRGKRNPEKHVLDVLQTQATDRIGSLLLGVFEGVRLVQISTENDQNQSDMLIKQFRPEIGRSFDEVALVIFEVEYFDES